MTQIILDASEALARNDAERLQGMCNTVSGNEALAPEVSGLSEEERSAMRIAVLAFQRQVLAARANVIVRQRLLASRAGEMESWAR